MEPTTRKIGIAITNLTDWTATALIAAAKQKNITPVIINLQTADVTIQHSVHYSANDTDLSELDAIIVRDVGAGTLEGVSFRFDILRQLEMNGTLVVNTPQAIQNAANKYHSTCLLAQANLPVPRTTAVQSTEGALKALAEFGDAIIKPVFGYKGMGIVRIKDNTAFYPNNKPRPESIKQLIDDLITEKEMLYIQEFITNPGRDIRAFVVNCSVIGAIYRTAPDGSWLNNLSQGGTAARCILSQEQEEICIRAAETIGTIFAGVDIIEGANGPVILEVNGTPSGAGIYEAWGINAAEHIIDYVTTGI
ncbi:MAG: tetrahydromethanopterin:alpha-L-glutamate ligase [Methanosarcinaceae archaeon]|nr:tetrahydromethanopterin:alpha-L-glutamate ligase [Methanosarcinaceae archaeon]